MPPKPDWHTPYPPPGLVPPPPHPPQSTLSRFFVVSPVKTGTHSKIPEFSLPCALGLHSHHLLHLPTMLSPGATICAHLCTLLRLSHTCVHLAHLLCTIAHLFMHIHAPLRTFALPLRTFCAHLRTLVHLCAPLCTFPCTFAHLRTPFAHLPHTFRAPMCTLHSIFQVCHPYPTFFLTSDPLLATMGNPALVQPGIVPTSRPLYNQVQPLQPPCCPSVFPVGLHNPHSRSRTRSGSHTTHPMAHGW